MKKLIVKEVIEKVEGEAIVEYSFVNNRVNFAKIMFFNSRHIEEILVGRPLEDALVITPRVCGICGHAHLIAAVRAIENCYDFIELTNKAKYIREVTLSLELIQNHFKWFYLTIMPLLGFNNSYKKALEPSKFIGRMIATVAGQYPHNSYAIAGGIVNEVTPLEIISLKNLLNELKSIFRKTIIDVDFEKFIVCDRVDVMLEKSGDLPKVMNTIINRSWQNIGKSSDKFIVFGKSSIFKSGKSIKTRVSNYIDSKYIKFSYTQDSESKVVKYKNSFYEVGPLSRAMLIKTPLIKDAHRRYKDSLFSRILARVCEIPRLIKSIEALIEDIDLNDASFIEPKGNLTKNGVGIVEAARGSLIHKIEHSNGIITKYTIVTPTQWNLANSTKDNPSVVQKALIGLNKDDPLELVFKSFDVCSVCTVV